jgi:pimeloyl-ACP methyl ester carboxylesterase
MTLDRLVDDALEVTEHVCNRLSQRKVILVGQSWGSFLGVHVVKRRPDLFHAFVGTGQVVSVVDNAADRVKWATQQATAAGDLETLRALANAEKLPGPQRVMAELNASGKYRLSPSDRLYAKILYDFMNRGTSNAAMSDAELSKLVHNAKGDAAAWLAGAEFSGSKLETVIKTMDVRPLGLDVKIPFFVIQGREDHITSFDAARLYVESLQAPTKAFIPIDGGHWACFTNAAQFVSVLRDRVRPFAI